MVVVVEEPAVKAGFANRSLDCVKIHRGHDNARRPRAA
jgi:hypothetical protein